MEAPSANNTDGLGGSTEMLSASKTIETGSEQAVGQMVLQAFSV
jgi:hypothetical protein